ncbi:hypothetical protein [Streptomyces zagrosensis]|uniref:Uncharacterized protein n=1 Tax=Streptomyces zagrosensis TaxID=1042984 RepID=A0A7W9UY00_9ACTN|nr:hypothetical protein [Streptomyces zagrosensis]MBB5935147.1 hypothetical protein [Streptomyces zagrosensis]
MSAVRRTHRKLPRPDECVATNPCRVRGAERNRRERVTREARELGATGRVEVNDRAIVVEGLDEPPRYYLQHGFGYQCHDQAKPHHYRQHGRAEIGWKAEDGTPAS